MNLSDLIARNAAFMPDKAALRFEGRTVTYAALNERIAQAARALKSQLGVGRGDRVAILALNHPDYLVLLYACARLGALLLPLNWRLAVPEQMFILSDASAKVLIVEREFAAVVPSLKQALPDIRIVGLGEAAGSETTFDDLLTSGSGDGSNPHIDESCPLLLVYTSGTTGRPKGAVLRQEALLWNGVMSHHMHDMTAADHILTVLPLFHVGGLNIQTTPALHIGATVTVHARFAPDATLAGDRKRQAVADGAGAGDHPGLHRASGLGLDRSLIPARAHHRLDPGAGAADRGGGGARRAGAAGLWLDRDLSGRGLQPHRRRSVAQDIDGIAGAVVRGARRRRAGSRHAAGRRRRSAGARAQRVLRILGQRGGDRRGAAQRLVSHRRYRQP